MKSEPRFTAKDWRDLIGADARYVIEAGSHDGTDTEMLLEAFPKAEIHCFEPDARPIGRFWQRFSERDRARVFLRQEAVSDCEDRVPWYASHGQMPEGSDPLVFSEAIQQDWDASGSIMVPTGHLTIPSWLEFRKEGTVSTISLDVWAQSFSFHFPKIDLLWADIQGAELRMIEGARRLLGITRYAYLEVHDTSLTENYDVPDELYEGQPSLEGLEEALTGWTLLGFYNEDSVLFRNDNVRPAF